MARPRPATLATALLVAALVAAGCSGGQQSPATPSSAPSTAPSDVPSFVPTDTPAGSPTDSPVAALPDPCSLITMAEASKVTGGGLQAPVPEGDPVTRCVWTAPPTGEVAQLEIDLGDGAKKSFDIDRTVLSHTFKPVPGIGDEAWAEDDAIFFRSGSTWVGIHLVRLNDPASNAAPLATLAAAVARRL